MQNTNAYRFSAKNVRRYEPDFRPEEKRDSDISQLRPPRKAGRKPTTDMIASMPSALKRADYALMRILRLELQIAKLIKLVGKDAATLVIAERPSLKRFV